VILDDLYACRGHFYFFYVKELISLDELETFSRKVLATASKIDNRSSVDTSYCLNKTWAVRFQISTWQNSIYSLIFSE